MTIIVPRVMLYITILTAFGNTVLRPSIESDITAYRLFAPMALIAVFFARPALVIRYAVGYLVFALYGWYLAVSYSHDLSQFIPSLVHYLYLFVLLVMLVYMTRAYSDFETSFMRFFWRFYVFLWISLGLEFAFGIKYPNLYVPENDLPAVRAFYWNQNDVAVVLCTFAWLFLVDDRYSLMRRSVLAAFTAAVLIYNDSKAALISLFFSVLVAFVFSINGRVRIRPSVWVAASIVVFASALVPIIAILDRPVAFVSGGYSLDDLLYQPVKRVLTLETTGEFWGSLNNRTDAAISVLIEYFRTYGIGLGPGGSWLVLTLPQYELGGAKSPHNALLQFAVDFGFPVVLAYGYLVFWAMRRVFRRDLDYPARVKVMAILSFPLLGLSQSGAIVTNFAFFALVIYIVLMGRTRRPARESIETNQTASPNRGVFANSLQ